MDIVIVERDSAEWDYMWEWLEAHPINEGIEEPRVAVNSGEVWQYMSTYRQGDKCLSEFRHRCHPRTNKVEKIVFEHKEPIKAESISKVIKVR